MELQKLIFNTLAFKWFTTSFPWPLHNLSLLSQPEMSLHSNSRRAGLRQRLLQREQKKLMKNKLGAGWESNDHKSGLSASRGAKC